MLMEWIPNNGSRMRYSLRILLLAATTLAGCDGFTSVAGRVTNPLGQRIEGARVTLDAGLPESVETGKDGSFHIGMMDSPYGAADKFSVVKEGYEPHVEQLRSNTEQKDLTVVLVPRASSSEENDQRKQTR
jgi:hypothetical protein